MVPKTCSREDCNRKTRARGLCISHYNSARLAGQFETTPRTPTRRTCSFDGCEKKHLANGLCAAHRAQRRAGGELRPAKTLGMPLEERFNMYVDKSGNCWEWTGYKSKKGYGVFSPAATSMGAHRVAYELANGPIPEGAEVDHACLNRGCVKPDHLRLATRKENMENLSGGRGGTPAYRGVSYRKDRKVWAAYVGHNQKQIHLGYFDSPEAASQAATAKRLELFTYNELDRSLHVAR